MSWVGIEAPRGGPRFRSLCRHPITPRDLRRCSRGSGWTFRPARRRGRRRRRPRDALSLIGRRALGLLAGLSPSCACDRSCPLALPRLCRAGEWRGNEAKDGRAGDQPGQCQPHHHPSVVTGPPNAASERRWRANASPPAAPVACSTPHCLDSRCLGTHAPTSSSDDGHWAAAPPGSAGRGPADRRERVVDAVWIRDLCGSRDCVTASKPHVGARRRARGWRRGGARWDRAR